MKTLPSEKQTTLDTLVTDMKACQLEEKAEHLAQKMAALEREAVDHVVGLCNALYTLTHGIG